MKKEIQQKVNELNQLTGLNLEVEHCTDYGGSYYLRDGESLAFGVDWLDFRLKESDLLGYISGLIVMYEYLNKKK